VKGEPLAIVIEDAAYAIGGAHLLQPTSLRFAEGRMNIILGPNGAGKSTLMRLAAGGLRPTQGRILYGDRDIRSFGAKALALRRAFLSQHVEIDFAVAVEEVVLMGRYPHFARAPAPRDRAIVGEALDLVGMAGRRSQIYQTLSGGEQQKVQLARVLAQIWADEADAAPRILFLDEPTASVDIHYQLHILRIARDFLSRNCTVVMTLHDLNLAADFGDRLFLMKDGALAHVAEGGGDLPMALIERIFDVRAVSLGDDQGHRALHFFL
jgi:iron complex transport system ATP-binding protein